MDFHVRNLNLDYHFSTSRPTRRLPNVRDHEVNSTQIDSQIKGYIPYVPHRHIIIADMTF